jgi:hypothetical protein
MLDEKTFKLRYVGARFAGARLPVNVLPDLQAFRDLLVSFAKEEWKERHPDRQRVPKGFDASLTFDLTIIEDGSAVPNIVWNRDVAQATLPGFEDELASVVDASYLDVLKLFESAGGVGPIKDLSAEKVRALDKFGSALIDGEKIEFGRGISGNVIYLDLERRKRLITSQRDTYNHRYSGIGTLASNSVYGQIIIRTGLGDISVPIDPQEIIDEFDGSLDQEVQFDILVELDSSDTVRKVIDVYDVMLVDDGVEAAMHKCQLRLSDISKLSAGWRDGEGNATVASTVTMAREFIEKRSSVAPNLKLYPNDQGGVLAELEQGGWDISVEFLADGSVEMYGIETNGEGDFDPIAFASLSDDFFARFDKKIGRG